MNQLLPTANLEMIPSIYATQPSERVSEQYGFIPTTDIQKTNMEFLEDFGDLEVEDLEFRVQVGVFKKRTSYHFPKLRGLGKVSNVISKK